MTRINVVPPKELSGPHLVAEYRELPRIFNLVRTRIQKGHTPSNCKIPPNYRLGFGHVLFFYNKLEFLRKRQISLINEMLNRGYSPSFGPPDISDVSQEWKNDYVPTEEAIEINKARIKERS
jgi:deoxyribonuclease (pyrimidine dimer)